MDLNNASMHGSGSTFGSQKNNPFVQDIELYSRLRKCGLALLCIRFA
eukprot:SAG22_NODE_1031_length_5932_cov_2.590948_3_plen_47_part_00